MVGLACRPQVLFASRSKIVIMIVPLLFLSFIFLPCSSFCSPVRKRTASPYTRPLLVDGEIINKVLLGRFAIFVALTPPQTKDCYTLLQRRSCVEILRAAKVNPVQAQDMNDGIITGHGHRQERKWPSGANRPSTAQLITSDVLRLRS